MNRAKLLDLVATIMAELGLTDDNRVLSESESLSSLGLDEIDIIEIVDDLEEELDFDIPDTALDEPPTTVGGLMDLFNDAIEDE